MSSRLRLVLVSLLSLTLKIKIPSDNPGSYTAAPGDNSIVCGPDSSKIAVFKVSGTLTVN